MDEKKLWIKISGSINYYLRYYDREKSDEELLEDYLYCTLEGESEMYEYLDKQPFEFIELSDEIVDKAINAFIERLKKNREKEAPKEISDKFKNNVYKFHGKHKELLDIYEKLSSPNQKRVLTYSKNLLVNQQMEEDLTVQAAHGRTDIEITDEMNQHDDDIMDDENF